MNKLWKIRKNMLSKRQETYDTLDTNNQPITDPELKSQLRTHSKLF